MLFILIFGCNESEDAKNFVRPTFINSQFSDSIARFSIKSDSLVATFPPFIGKYQFGDTVDLNVNLRDTTYRNDYLREYRIGDDDSLDVHGLEFIVDYDQEVYYHPYYDPEYDSGIWRHYPVYLVNSTTTDKVFIAKDRYVFGIQEALATERFKRWRPLESSGFDFCGNGGWGLVIHPGEFVVFLMLKYEGESQTKLRVRLELGSSILVSKPFNGLVNPKQFEITENSYAYGVIEERHGTAPSWLFYGALTELEENWVENKKNKADNKR